MIDAVTSRYINAPCPFGKHIADVDDEAALFKLEVSFEKCISKTRQGRKVTVIVGNREPELRYDI